MVVSPLVTKGYGTPTMIVTFGYGAVPPIPSGGGGGGGGGDMFYPDYCDYHPEDERCKVKKDTASPDIVKTSKDIVQVCIVEQDMDKCQEILVPKIELQELDFNLQEEIIQGLRTKLEEMQLRLDAMEMNKVITVIQKSEDPKIVFDLDELKKLVKPVNEYEQQYELTIFDILVLPIVMFFNELNRIMKILNESNIELLKQLEHFASLIPPLPIIVLPPPPLLSQLPELPVIDVSPARIDPVKRPNLPILEFPQPLLPPDVPEFPQIPLFPFFWE